MTRLLETAHGRLHFPAFLPVTTFGNAFPLDELVRPYLSRYSHALMVSYHYAKAMKRRPDQILFVDSGGFASLSDDAAIVEAEGCAAVRTKEGSTITPEGVLRFQERYADIGATLDFIVAPSCHPREAVRRQDATISNALWALANRRRPTLRLFASVQAWDAASAQRAMEQLGPHPFDGFALGGMVPRTKRPDLVHEIVQAIRRIETCRPLHVFGIGSPHMLPQLVELGVDSVDSSTYARAAADGTRLVSNSDRSCDTANIMSPTCLCPICQRLGNGYLLLEGEANRMALALHNLGVLTHCMVRHSANQA
jgi:helicase